MRTMARMTRTKRDVVALSHLFMACQNDMDLPGPFVDQKIASVFAPSFAKSDSLSRFLPFDDRHNLMVSPTFSFAGFADTLAPRPISIWTTVSWKNNGDLTGIHWVLAVTAWGYDGVSILNNPLHTCIQIIIVHLWIFFSTI